MAKITDKITGYADMTAEEKLAALEELDIEDSGKELERMKNAVSKANSEAAAWKKKHNELLSEEERKRQEREEHYSELEKELEGLRKDKTIADYTGKLLGMGYEEGLAKETAQAMADGDTATVFANQAKFNEALVQKTIAEKLKSTPRPGITGTPGVGMTLKQLKALSDADYHKFAKEHPDEYRALYEKGE